MKLSKSFKLIIILILVCSFAKNAFAMNVSDEIVVLIDGLQIHSDVKPIIQNGRVLLPFRVLAEALGVKVYWESATQTVRAEDGKESIRLTIGNSTAFRNDTPVLLDASPVIINDKTLIPTRFFSEAFGCGVEWLDSNKTVKIHTPSTRMNVIGFYALGDNRTSSWTNLFGKAYPETGVGNTDLISELALGWYSLDAEGNLLVDSSSGWRRPDSWEQVLATTEKYKLGAEMVVQLTDGEGVLTKILESQEASNTAIDKIASEARLYQGVNLDFEGLGWMDKAEQLEVTKQRFNQFVESLANQLKKDGLKLTLTLHPPNSAYQGYDYSTLGKLADRIIIMAYDYGQRPEPVSLVTQAVEMALANVPSQKLLLGISTPNETSESIVAKIGIAKKYKLSGIALWRLGLVSNEMFNALRSTVKNYPGYTTTNDSIEKDIKATNPSNTSVLFDARKVKIGQQLSEMKINLISIPNPAEDNYSATVAFSGRTEVSGKYKHQSNDELLGNEISFVVDETSQYKLPKLTHDKRYLWFCIANHDEAERAFGPPGSEGKATVAIDNYTINYQPSDVYNMADLIEILSIEKFINN